jgi:hypothetical protein
MVVSRLVLMFSLADPAIALGLIHLSASRPGVHPAAANGKGPGIAAGPS